MHLPVPLDYGHAVQVGQPVRHVFLRAAERDDDVRRLVLRRSAAHKTLSVPDVDDLEQLEAGVLQDVPEGCEPETPAAQQPACEAGQELRCFLGIRQGSGLPRRVVHEPFLGLEPVVG